MADDRHSGVPQDFLEEYRQKHHERYSDREAHETNTQSSRALDDDVYQLVGDEEYGETVRPPMETGYRDRLYGAFNTGYFHRFLGFFTDLFHLVVAEFKRAFCWIMSQFAGLSSLEATAFSVFISVLSLSLIMLIVSLI